MSSELTFDKEGFLTSLDLWSETIAHEVAAKENIILSKDHLDVIYLLRDFYQKYQVAPSNRPLVKLVKTQIAEHKGNSIYLMTLFPESPAKIAAKIAGLPKPPNCL
jgi:tRNA 2-thiouridine synthesizing protein E